MGAEVVAVRDALYAAVGHLATEIGERSVLRPTAQMAAADWIGGRLRALGLPVANQWFEVKGTRYCNVEAIARGGDVGGEVVIVGAHYDSVPGTPGANDNASGVAGLLEVARMVSGTDRRREVRFVAFANEEPPFFQTDGMGSLVYARRCRERGQNVVGMVALETLGFYSDQEGSQQYPPPLGLLYPDRANFIGFVGNGMSCGLVRRAIQEFRRTTKFPSEGACVPECIPGIGWSDHWAFWQCRYPAIMITDTAPFRYAHYHKPTDTADRLDYDRMARVVTGIGAVVGELAETRMP
jgi:hypothetical protein